MLQNIPLLPWLLAAAVALLLVWLAWRRPNRQRLLWRVAASMVAGVAFVMLLFPPSVQRAVDPSTAILLSEGYDRDTLNALLKRFEAAPLLLSYKTAASAAERILDLYTFRQQHPSVQTVHLLGYGLEEQELQALEGIPLISHLTDKQERIISLHWPERIQLGEAVIVAGQFKSPASEETQLYLQAAAQAQDSVTLAGDSTSAFRLRFVPKQAGRYTYSVVSSREGQLDTLGSVPVQVEQQDKLRVLFLASAPMAEFKFLKTYLAQLQHQVGLRTTVSKGIYQSEWLNMPETSLDRLTPALLDQFDILVTEPQSLQKISSAERASLQRAVSETGLGVLTIVGEQPANRSTAFFTSFGTRRVGQQETRATRAVWGEGTAEEVTALPLVFANDDAVAGIVAGQGEQFLAARKRAGWGSVAVTAVPQTFMWLLEGKQATYSSYWANMLSAIAKKEALNKFWELASPKVAKLNQPLTLTYTDFSPEARDEVPEAFVVNASDSTATGIPLSQNPLQPEQFTGTFWPPAPGWYTVKASDAAAAPYHFYVQDTTEWTFTAIQRKRQATQAFAARQAGTPSETPAVYAEKPLPLFWFFALFVLSSGFLWLEEKL